MLYEEYCYKQYRADEHKSDGESAVPLTFYLLSHRSPSPQSKRSPASKSANAT